MRACPLRVSTLYRRQLAERGTTWRPIVPTSARSVAPYLYILPSIASFTQGIAQWQDHPASASAGLYLGR